MADNDVIVIDNGSKNTRVGFIATGEQAPRSIFPTVVGRRPGQTTPEAWAGDQAIRCGVMNLTYPITRGIINNWDDIEKIWQHTYYNELRVEPGEHPVLLTESILNPKPNREKMVQIMFETFGTPGMHVANQATLALFGNDRSTGVVIESGDGITQVVPVYEGHALPHASARMDLAGSDLTIYLAKLLAPAQFTTSPEREVARDIKEKLCYVALDFEQEMQSFAAGPHTSREYEMPDGYRVTAAQARCQCPEAMFTPSALGLECDGIHNILYNCIAKCEPELQKELYNNIIISGGNTMFPGFAQRLTKELIKIAPSTANIKVRAHYREQTNTVWVGGANLASVGLLSSFVGLWISKFEYDECGASIVHRKCFY